MRDTKSCIRTCKLVALITCLCLMTAGCARQPAPTLVPTIAPTTAPTAAPTPSAPTPEPTPSLVSGDITLGMVAPAGATINPFQTRTRDILNLNGLVFESCVELDDAMQPVPLLADRWTVEGLVWTFTLRSGISFHDGSPLEAADVVASYEAIIQAGEASAFYERVQLIDSIFAQDERTLVVNSVSSGYKLLYAMTFPVAQRNSLSAAYLMGTGPYWFIEYDGATALRLEVNPLWWKRRPQLTSIVARRYDTSAQALGALELGEIDALATNSMDAALSKDLSDRVTTDYPQSRYECLVPNLQNELLSDLNVRQALLYAIDRTTLANTIYLGMALESEVPVLPGSWLYETQSTKYNYSPERALQLLMRSGWSDSDQNGTLDRVVGGLRQELSLTLITYEEPDRATRSEAAAFIKRQLAVVGIRLDVITLSRSEVLKRMRAGDYELAMVAYTLSDFPDLTFLLGSKGGGNYSGYANGEMDALLSEARSAMTADELVQALSKVQIKLVEELPILGLFFRTGVVVSKVPLGSLHGLREIDAYNGLELWEDTGS